MKITVCSGFNPGGYKLYGRKFLETFDKYWPKEVDLVVYTEEQIKIPRGIYRNFWDCDGARDFNNRHGEDPRRNGTKATESWGQKDLLKGYSWRFDALKFFKQCLIPNDVVKDLQEDDILVWLDGDVVTFDYVPLDFIPDLVDNNDLVYFGRGRYHSEIGFWAIRVNYVTRDMLKDLAETYTTDHFLDIKEHHSAFVFDYVRLKAKTRGLREKNLTPGSVHGHVWMISPLARYTDHLKGNIRKRMGFSSEHPLKWWKNR